ncbi:MAG: M48 family metallopeptidase [Rikenellaceae bacterium]
MQLSYTDKILGTVILNESRRAQNVSIKVSRSSDTITLTYPIGYSKQRAIEFLESARERVQKIQLHNKTSRQENPPSTTYNEAILRSQAKEYLPQRIAEISKKTSLRFNKLTIRASRSRWGSCSSQNNISLSIYLMALPQHLIDFVIIHELCHTVHHNHSTKFHALVDFICSGREKEFERELRKHSIR